jgi:hypothetical protein
MSQFSTAFLSLLDTISAMRFALCVFLREADAGKPKSNRDLQGLLGLAAFVFG